MSKKSGEASSTVHVASAPCSMHEVDPAYMGFADTVAEPTFKQAPAIETVQWFNSAEALTLDGLRGRVVVIEAFQMLCPGCVAHGIPQAQRIHDTFSREDVVVLGLHTVFEHHAAMTPISLEAFLHEYRVSFPVGVDAPQTSGTPMSMQAYAMQGTPTLVLVDGQGRLRKQWFGAVSDLIVGAEVMRLVLEQHATEVHSL